MFKIFDYPGDAPDLPTLSRLCHSLAEMSLQNHRMAVANIKVMQAVIQDLAARDPEIVDRLRRVFELSTVGPDIMPSVNLILKGVTKPDDPRALHESDLVAPKH
jgi:hypothetical protein